MVLSAPRAEAGAVSKREAMWTGLSKRSIGIIKIILKRHSSRSAAGVCPNDHLPTNVALRRLVLVMVLRRQRHIGVMRNFLSASFAAVDTREDDFLAGLVRRLEHVAVVLGQVGQILVPCHRLLPWKGV
jgi:hypothetical protein